MKIHSWKESVGFPLAPNTVFRGCWEYELQTGEVTQPRAQSGGQEIHLILEGEGLVTVGDITREVRSGELVFVPEGAQHSVQNVASPLLRGLSVTASVPVLDPALAGSQKVTLRELEEVIDSIPPELSAPQALQLIIRLFDLAGYLSEQIEDAIGLDSETGMSALEQIEDQVMSAVVLISRSYESGPLRQHPRF